MQDRQERTIFAVAISLNLRLDRIGLWCNGSTRHFGRLSSGSKPDSPTPKKGNVITDISPFWFFWQHYDNSALRIRVTLVRRMYGGVRGRKTKVGRKLLRFPPTRLCRDDKTRTCDLAPPRRVRYQLRYIPSPFSFCSAKVGCFFSPCKYFRNFVSKLSRI